MAAALFSALRNRVREMGIGSRQSSSFGEDNNASENSDKKQHNRSASEPRLAITIAVGSFSCENSPQTRSCFFDSDDCGSAFGIHTTARRSGVPSPNMDVLRARSGERCGVQPLSTSASQRRLAVGGLPAVGRSASPSQMRVDALNSPRTPQCSPRRAPRLPPAPRKVDKRRRLNSTRPIPFRLAPNSPRSNGRVSGDLSS